MKSMTQRIRHLSFLALIPVMIGCSDVLTLDVEAPGRIADEDLNNPDAISALVVGMSYDYTQALDGLLQELALATGNLWHGGSYDFGTVPLGILQEEPEEWDGEWGSMSQARWVAENGIQRIANVLDEAEFNRNLDVARAYLMAGFANRLMGEVMCTTTIDGGPEVPHTEHFNRADTLFSRAISIAQSAGAPDIVEAAYGGRASIMAWLGNWSAAESDAANVDPDFTYDAFFSTSSVPNDLVYETTQRKEFTVFMSEWEDYPDDDRVPWQIVYDNAGQVEKGQDGSTDFYQQLKYVSQDSDIPLTHGTEMLVLRAEARLRAGDLPGMTELLNDARDVYDMEHLDVPANATEAWPILRYERYATTWLEGRKLWDLRRFEEEGGAAVDPYSANRDTCIPISDEERRSNPNLNSG